MCGPALVHWVDEAKKTLSMVSMYPFFSEGSLPFLREHTVTNESENALQERTPAVVEFKIPASELRPSDETIQASRKNLGEPESWTLLPTFWPKFGDTSSSRKQKAPSDPQEEVHHTPRPLFGVRESDLRRGQRSGWSRSRLRR